LVKPEWHVTPHVPLAHTGVPFAVAGHTLPQLPQFAGSMRVSMHRSPAQAV
jgi:hypothetical protein